jgi:hypothetical protein
MLQLALPPCSQRCVTQTCRWRRVGFADEIISSSDALTESSSLAGKPSMRSKRPGSVERALSQQRKAVPSSQVLEVYAQAVRILPVQVPR